MTACEVFTAHLQVARLEHPGIIESDEVGGQPENQLDVHQDREEPGDPVEHAHLLKVVPDR